MARVYLGLGANLGDRRANFHEALRLLEPFAHVEAVSALYESPPQPPAPPPDYLNAAVLVTTDLSPEELRQRTYAIERQLGRIEGPMWSPRPLDIDILLYDDLVQKTDELVIPHPLMLTRAFVLRPLLDIDPELVHPVTGQRLDEAFRALGEVDLWQVAENWHE